MTPGDCAERRVLAMAPERPTVLAVVSALKEVCGIYASAAHAILLRMTATHGIVIRGGRIEIDECE